MNRLNMPHGAKYDLRTDSGAVIVSKFVSASDLILPCIVVFVTVVQATVRISEPPSVECQLQTQRLARGEMLAIVATASGIPQPHYQWRRNGVPIPGANRPMLVRHSVTEEDMGTYTCDVSTSSP